MCNISEFNKIIAEFMGGFVPKTKLHFRSGTYICIEINPPIKNQVWYNIDSELLYHSSWEWLMPVWKKIVDIGDNISSTARVAYFTSIKHSLYVCDINGVFEGIVEFINWYNQLKK